MSARAPATRGSMMIILFDFNNAGTSIVPEQWPFPPIAYHVKSDCNSPLLIFPREGQSMSREGHEAMTQTQEMKRPRVAAGS